MGNLPVMWWIDWRKFAISLIAPDRAILNERCGLVSVNLALECANRAGFEHEEREPPHQKIAETALFAGIENGSLTVSQDEHPHAATRSATFLPIFVSAI